MSLLDFLWHTPIRLDHPIFGIITLEKRGKKGFYWMHNAYEDDDISISIDSLDATPPTELQAEFFRKITLDPDMAFSRTAELIVPRHEQFFRRPFPAQWRSALRLCGAGIPLHGVETQPWDISFECLTDNSGHIFTCYFVNGCPSHVSLDT